MMLYINNTNILKRYIIINQSIFNVKNSKIIIDMVFFQHATLQNNALFLL